MPQSSNAGADGTPTTPIVFSCGRCRTVIGDSLNLVCTNGDLRIVTLSGANNILKVDNLITSKEPLDRGSTFFPLQCAECKGLLGKYYLTTPRAFDDLRERFSLLADQISTYILGEIQTGEILEAQDKSDEAKQEDNRSVVDSSDSNGKDSEIEKVQHVLVDLALRLAEAETSLRLLQEQQHDEQLSSQEAMQGIQQQLQLLQRQQQQQHQQFQQLSSTAQYGFQNNHPHQSMQQNSHPILQTPPTTLAQNMQQPPPLPPSNSKRSEQQDRARHHLQRIETREESPQHNVGMKRGRR